MGDKPKAGINTVRSQWEHVFSPATRRELHDLLDFDESLIPNDPDDVAAYKASLSGAEVVLSTWGAHAYTPDLLSVCPDISLVLYGAGSVKGFVTDELVQRNVTVCSAVHLNAQPVAEFVLGIILSSLKNVYTFNHSLHQHGREGWQRDKVHFSGGYYHSSVGLLGFGRVTRALITLLGAFEFDVYLNDPHLSTSDIEALGVSEASEEWILANCDVVSLHHGNTPENRHMIDRDKIALLKSGARFINTARGQLVDETALADRLSQGDITAYLDVTYPEPPEDGHRFYKLPNCIMTPHVAGSVGVEARRMGDFCLKELQRWLSGSPLENPIDLESVHHRG
jgi:phosphoglycerate dehydrogenase-like enzyme